MTICNLGVRRMLDDQIENVPGNDLCTSSAASKFIDDRRRWYVSLLISLHHRRF